MTEPRRPNETTQKPGVEHSLIDEELLARAAEINGAVAGEFAERRSRRWRTRSSSAWRSFAWRQPRR
jgi:hypothetical protein